jgi:hypothetical protein
MPKPIKLVVRGKAPSLMDTELANQVIGAINSLIVMQVQPSGTGKVVVSQGGVVIDLTPMHELIKGIEERMKKASATASCGAGNTVTVNVTI